MKYECIDVCSSVPSHKALRVVHGHFSGVYEKFSRIPMSKTYLSIDMLRPGFIAKSAVPLLDSHVKKHEVGFRGSLNWCLLCLLEIPAPSAEFGMPALLSQLTPPTHTPGGRLCDGRASALRYAMMVA